VALALGLLGGGGELLLLVAGLTEKINHALVFGLDVVNEPVGEKARHP
jgi:hypothetical protein